MKVAKYDADIHRMDAEFMAASPERKADTNFVTGLKTSYAAALAKRKSVYIQQIKNHPDS